MNIKRLKYIMEMIFIFILPILFILPCIKVEDNYIYDNEGNYNSSSKEIVFNSPFDLSVNTIEEETFLTSSYLASIDSTYEVSYNSQYDWLELTDGDDFLFYPNGGTIWFLEEDTGDNWENQTYSFYVYIENSSTGVFNCTLHYGGNFGNDRVDVIPEDEYDAEMFTIYNNNGYNANMISISQVLLFLEGQRYYECIPNINFIHFDDLCYRVVNRYTNVNVITENEDLTIYGKIKSLFVNYLQINDSILLDFVMTYTILWIIMFIIWHLIYLLLDFLLHFWRKEDKS